MATGVIGMRRRLERPDSRVVHLLVRNGRGSHDVILKSHRSRPGESQPAIERARKEFDVLRALGKLSDTGSGVPALNSASFCASRASATTMTERRGGM